MKESTCHEMVIHLLQRFSSMLGLFFFALLHAAAWILGPFGEVDANFSLQISSQSIKKHKTRGP